MFWPLFVFTVTVIGFTETVINDVFSREWSWRRLQEWRYAMLFLCACFYGSVLYMCSAKNVSWAAYPIFAMFCFFVLLHMFLDMRARFKW